MCRGSVVNPPTHTTLQKMVNNDKKAPGAKAKADNQGSSQTCSGHALAKAATQGDVISQSLT